MIKQLNVTIPFTDAKGMMLKYSKLLKDLITKKKSLKDYGVVTLEKDCNAILKKQSI